MQTGALLETRSFLFINVYHCNWWRCLIHKLSRLIRTYSNTQGASNNSELHFILSITRERQWILVAIVYLPVNGLIKRRIIWRIFDKNPIWRQSKIRERIADGFTEITAYANKLYSLVRASIRMIRRSRNPDKISSFWLSQLTEMSAAVRAIKG